MSTCINPVAFGPYYWAVIHLACLSGADGLQDFVNSLPGILPCPDCREHLQENLKQLPFDSKDPFRWSVNLHNAVNKRLGKPSMSYKQAFDYWSSTCSPKSKNHWWIVVLVCIVCLVLGMVFR
jgi:Erv1 / Alr family